MNARIYFPLCAFTTIGFCKLVPQCPDDASRICDLQRKPRDAVSLLQLERKHSMTVLCPDSPNLDGKSVKSIIDENEGVLVLAMPDMRCTQAVKQALSTKAVSFKEVNFNGDFQYTQGASDVWDWLHCTYPDDLSNGAVMHSYIFKGTSFLGNGFAAADKIDAGDLDKDLGVKAGQSCEDKFPNEAKVLAGFMSKSSAKVLLFGWLNCPCVGIAQARLGEKSVCWDGRTWADPTSKLMAYFQCREKEPESHSFIYFRSGSGWSYAGNGFKLADDEMTEEVLKTKLSEAKAETSCKRATVKINLFGSPLEECQVGDDTGGSWMDDGTCSEQTGGIHQICIEALPADFSSETKQSPWSQERKDKRHCVCVGAWSLYMTDADKHKQGADAIMPHCKAIPETTLTKEYLGHWRDWNGYPASVLTGVKELVSRCLTQAETPKEKCGLKERFDKLYSDKEAGKDLQKPELADVANTFKNMQCADTSLLQVSHTACH
mmetsp:Transcript_117401/g.204017  ORF Transcript_117401/g.204017 Transcript_117401/m.204017 type:complete len:490 (-) Transcript_117401:280-1749(-)